MPGRKRRKPPIHKMIPPKPRLPPGVTINKREKTVSYKMPNGDIFVLPMVPNLQDRQFFIESVGTFHPERETIEDSIKRMQDLNDGFRTLAALHGNPELRVREYRNRYFQKGGQWEWWYGKYREPLIELSPSLQKDYEGNTLKFQRLNQLFEIASSPVEYRDQHKTFWQLFFRELQEYGLDPKHFDWHGFAEAYNAAHGTK